MAAGVTIPVFGSGDCLEPSQLVDRLASAGIAGVLVGRGALRNPWIFQQAAALARGEAVPVDHAGGSRPVPARVHRPAAPRTDRRGRRFQARRARATTEVKPAARGHDRWVINKLRALNSWYTKGLDNGSHLRTAINASDSLPRLREVISEFFGVSAMMAR